MYKRQGEGRSARAADDTGVIQLLDIRVAPARLGHVREREGGTGRRGGIGCLLYTSLPMLYENDSISAHIPFDGMADMVG